MYKVLLVDDEPIIREGLRTLIEWERYGYRVMDAAANGREALGMIGHYHPDLLIADIRMPGMSGLELIESVRAAGDPLHVLILSGYADFEYARKAIGYRADGYMLKPLDEEELIDNLTALKNTLDREAADAAGMQGAGRPGAPGATYPPGLSGMAGEPGVSAEVAPHRENGDPPLPAVDPADQAVSRMLDMIHRNYREPLRLEGMAELLNYNSAYLGKLFKRATGEYFNTYLDKVRIERAKACLSEGMKVYEAAEQVGYTSVDYFHAKFRRYVGASPSAYRKSLHGGGQEA